ncbi:hypothetical protein TIFTF001_049309 [Ficus carica]|uniref:Uncharacterized protein n=1 Tax=Ficus carica TaxID=3494 RepID=A0AA88CR01_FICCA|nr:hypothetical protein TIFTF001_049309 [Ficus carica]
MGIGAGLLGELAAIGWQRALSLRPVCEGAAAFEFVVAAQAATKFVATAQWEWQPPSHSD